MLKLRGVHAPHRKNTRDSVPRRIPTPPTVTIPMAMSIGAPAKPVVKPGDTVKVGQLIAEAGGFVSSPIYSSVSGKVKAIEDILVSSGAYVPAVVIESDGLQERYEGLHAPEVTDIKSFLAAVRESGVVGLGGAGFPTAVKLSIQNPDQLESIIVNGAECEPYITSDTRTMTDKAGLIWDGLLLMKKFFPGKRIYIAIEKNKPGCIKTFEEKCRGVEGIEVKALPSMYPQGGEKVLVYNVTGRIVAEGKLPLDAGAIVINCTTVAAIAEYIATGLPLIEKCITVDGSAVKNPQNVIAPIGTPVEALFDFCGGFSEEPKKVLYGGPMMGIAIPDLSCPVLKATNAVLAFNAKDAEPPVKTDCIKCGRCIAHCPLHLMPANIETAFDLNRPEELEALKVNLCMECGCCSFVCPAKHSLVQVNKLAKVMLRNYQNDKKARAEAEKAKTETKKEEAAVK